MVLCRSQVGVKKDNFFTNFFYCLHFPSAPLTAPASPRMRQIQTTRPDWLPNLKLTKTCQNEHYQNCLHVKSNESLEGHWALWDLHIKVTGSSSEILKRTAERYKNLVLWVWLKFIFTPKGRFRWYDFVACDMFTTSLWHKLCCVNQTYDSFTIIVYDTKNVVGFWNMF